MRRILAVTAALAFCQCGGNTASLTASDQTVDLTTELTVAEVTAPSDAWVVVEDGSGQVLGVSGVGRGTTSNVKVDFTTALVDGQQVKVVLFQDRGTVGVFEPSTTDTPFNGGNVSANITVTVPPGTPEAAVALQVGGSVSVPAWQIAAVTPVELAGDFSTQASNPPMTLQRGLRYRFVNPAFPNHPLELVSLGADPTGDTVLLAQEGGGILEGDPAIGFVATSTTVTFTLTPSLAAQLSGYRCAVHTGMMRGPIGIR